MTPENPFAPVHSRQSFLETVAGGEALRRLDDGIGAREPFLLVTAEPGTGKTALAHEAVGRWGARVRAAFLAYPAQTSVELLEEVIRRFGAEPPEAASRPRLFAFLERTLEENTAPGQVAMIVVDDAHDLPDELLEELRLLVNAAQKIQRPLEVLLLGLPSLEARLEEPAFTAIRQRVSVRARLEALGPGETKRYLHHRVTAAGGDGPATFTRRTCREIAALTGGVPRQINALAAEALRVARDWGDQAVGSDHVQTAAAGLWGAASMPVAGELDEAGDDDAPIPPSPAPAKAAPVAVPPPPPPAARPSQPRAATPPAAKPVAPRAQPPAPAAPPPRPAVKPPAPMAPRVEPNTPDSDYVMPTPPATHDPGEWVKRFVGDRGPLQISSRAAEDPWLLEVPVQEPAKAADPEASPSEAPAAEAPAFVDRRARKRKPTAPPPPRTRHRMRLPVPAIALALVAIVAIALVIRAGMRANPAPPPSAVLSAAKVDTAEAPARSGSSSRGPRRSSTDSEPSGTAGGKGPFTLDVGGYADLQDAIDERDRAQLLTGFEGWVIPADDGHKHRVVVGAYRSHARATSAANMLIRSRTLKRVSVVPLPPRDERL